MTKFLQKSFSVGAIISEQYRDNWDRIFGKQEPPPGAEEPEGERPLKVRCGKCVYLGNDYGDSGIISCVLFPGRALDTDDALCGGRRAKMTDDASVRDFEAVCGR